MTELLGHLLGLLVAAGIGVAGIGAPRLFVGRMPRCVYVCYGVWAVGVMFAIEWFLDRLLLANVLAVSDTGSLGLGLSVLAGAVVLLFVWFGLRKLWPTRLPLGFRTDNVPRAVVVGAIAGVVLVGALTDIFTKKLGTLPPYFWIVFVHSNLLSQCLLEEAVFRGRIMQLLEHITRSADAIVVVQAVLFAAVHLFGYIAYFGSATGEVYSMRALSLHFVTGYAFGLLRLRTGTLWAPLAAHLAYNLLFYAARLTT